MQKTEYGYRRAVRIGIICLIFALCMREYAFGSVVVDEVLIGGQEEQATSDAAPVVQASAEPDASQPQAEPDASNPVSEAQPKPESQSTSERQAKTAASHPVSELDTRSATPAPRSKVPAESTASVSANDRQQFHVPNQETQTNGDKTAKSGNSSGKNDSRETAKQERKTQEQPSVWQDTAETADKEKIESKAEAEGETGSLLLPGFILLCIVMLLAGSICLIRDNNIDLKK